MSTCGMVRLPNRSCQASRRRHLRSSICAARRCYRRGALRRSACSNWLPRGHRSIVFLSTRPSNGLCAKTRVSEVLGWDVCGRGGDIRIISTFGCAARRAAPTARHSRRSPGAMAAMLRSIGGFPATRRRPRPNACRPAKERPRCPSAAKACSPKSGSTAVCNRMPNPDPSPAPATGLAARLGQRHEASSAHGSGGSDGRMDRGYRQSDSSRWHVHGQELLLRIDPSAALL